MYVYASVCSVAKREKNGKTKETWQLAIHTIHSTIVYSHIRVIDFFLFFFFFAFPHCTVHTAHTFSVRS